MLISILVVCTVMTCKELNPFVTELRPFAFVVAGIVPETHSPGMFSWFPMFFPIRVSSVSISVVQKWNLWSKQAQQIFGRAQRSRDGLLESHVHYRCCHAGPPWPWENPPPRPWDPCPGPPRVPLTLTWHDDHVMGFTLSGDMMGGRRSSFSLTKRTCWMRADAFACHLVQDA